VPFRQLPLWLQLRADEADRHDPVLLGRPQQPGACTIPRDLVLERHLAKPREGIPDMRRVVDRQTATAARIDVCKGAVRKLRALPRAKRWHPRMIARTVLPLCAKVNSRSGGCLLPLAMQEATREVVHLEQCWGRSSSGGR
jgi:hypothetical protein